MLLLSQDLKGLILIPLNQRVTGNIPKSQAGDTMHIALNVCCYSQKFIWKANAILCNSQPLNSSPFENRHLVEAVKTPASQSGSGSSPRSTSEASSLLMHTMRGSWPWASVKDLGVCHVCGRPRLGSQPSSVQLWLFGG